MKAVADEIKYSPDELRPLPDGVIAAPEGATAVVLLAPESSDQAPMEAVQRIVEAWSSRGRPVVLADLHLSEPVLHGLFGLGNLEGVTDILLYGASVARSARPIPDRSFYLISAGTYVTDAEAVLRHGRWPGLIAGFRDERALLVLYAPASSYRALREADWVDRLIRLEASTPTLPAEGGRAQTGVETQPGDSDGLEPLDETPDAAVRPAERAASPDASEPIGLIATRTARRRRRQGTRSRLVFWLLVAIAILLALALAVDALRPGGLVPWGTAAGVTEVDGSGREDVPDGVVPISTALPYSVEVRNYASFEAAHERIAADRARAAGATLLVSPVLDRGVMYYRIFAGAAADTAEAAVMRETLRGAGIVPSEATAARADRIERTPFAFDLGARATRDDAYRGVDSLATLHIPAYTVRVRYDDGRERWRLYGGAYGDSLVAESMGRLLENAGLPAILVERVGIPSALAE